MARSVSTEHGRAHLTAMANVWQRLAAPISACQADSHSRVTGGSEATANPARRRQEGVGPSRGNVISLVDYRLSASRDARLRLTCDGLGNVHS
jgi:hypothetical protein